MVAWAQGQPQYLPPALTKFATVADGWLVAYAKSNGLVVVTHEVPSEARNEVKIPNVCRAFGVDYVDTFDMLGVSIAQTGIAVGDYVVINSQSGVTAYDAANNNRARISAVTAATNTITLAEATNVFAAQSPARPSPTQQFQIVPDSQKAVTYRCNGGQLRRYSNYGFSTAQVCPPAGGTNDLVVGNNAVCRFNFSNAFDLLYMTLSVSDSTTGEAVNLFDQIHVDNAP
jgi:hypothetical protein